MCGWGISPSLSSLSRCCEGTSGVITAYNPVKARYVVKLQGGEAKELSLKRANLLQLLDATVAETGAAATIAGLGTDGNLYEGDTVRRLRHHFGPFSRTSPRHPARTPCYTSPRAHVLSGC